MAKKVGFLGRIQEKITKTAKITIYNSNTTPGLLFLDSISRKRRMLESHADHIKQSNEDNID
jgi:hypothetical protein